MFRVYSTYTFSVYRECCRMVGNFVLYLARICDIWIVRVGGDVGGITVATVQRWAYTRMLRLPLESLVCPCFGKLSGDELCWSFPEHGTEKLNAKVLSDIQYVRASGKKRCPRTRLRFACVHVVRRAYVWLRQYVLVVINNVGTNNSERLTDINSLK